MKSKGSQGEPAAALGIRHRLEAAVRAGGRGAGGGLAVPEWEKLFREVILGDIEALTPSLNDVLGLHFAELTRKKRDWRLWALLAFDRYEIPPARPGEVRGLWIVSSRRQLVDQDNLVGGVKLLVDGMKAAGFIFDDSPAVLRLDVRQERVRTKQAEGTAVGLFFGKREARG